MQAGGKVASPRWWSELRCRGALRRGEVSYTSRVVVRLQARTRSRCRFGIALAIGVLVAAGSGSASAQTLRSDEAWAELGRGGIHGITVGPIESSQFPGRGYGMPVSARLLDQLAAMGVNWISITPFGRLWALDDTRVLMDFEAPYDSNREGVREMVAQAHARGIRVLLIPHLWVETGGWRGRVDPGSPEGWSAYQHSYSDFVLAWARDAAEAGADALSVGVEMKSLSYRFGAFWEQLIGDVRAVFPGLLTYSANWDEVDDVVFWEQLDFIGVNAFYPLANHPGASDAEYLEGARARVPELRELSHELKRPVLFVEIGYTTRQDAAVEPWLWPDDMQHVVIDEGEQARAMSALFEAFLPERFFAGFFVWRYYADLDDVSQEAIWGFSPHAKRAERLLTEVFHARWGVDPEPFPWLHPAPVPPPYPYAGFLPELFRGPGSSLTIP